MTSEIMFGTSGHRGIVGQNFTIKHVEAICAAVCTLLENDPKKTIIVGYDPRDGNSEQLKQNTFTDIVVSTLKRYGFTVLIFDTFSPTPLVSWYITHYHLSGGLILTASHNAPHYNGIKFNPRNGAPAPSDTTQRIEALSNDYLINGLPTPPEKPGSHQLVFAEKDFSFSLIGLIKQLSQKPILFQNLSIAIDAKHGACGPLWDIFFALFPSKALKTFHFQPLPDFGGLEPNPTKYEHLSDLSQHIINHHFDIGIANDPDGDRHVILDETGRHLIPEETTLIILDYLIRKDVEVAGIATTVASSRIIKQACQDHGIEFHETAVGFKHFASFFEACENKDIIGLAVESSGGFSISNHIFEKCGFLPGLLLVQIIADTGLSLSQLKQAVYACYGQSVFLEKEYRFNETQKDQLTSIFSTIKRADLGQYFDVSIESIHTIDGVKLVFSNQDWVLLRLSGTEPVVRLYAESDTHANTSTLLSRTQLLLNDWLSE